MTPAPLPRILAELDRLAGPGQSLGLALSGGGDSIALLHHLAAWRGDRRVEAATVDHDLRPGSHAEAEAAGHAAAALGVAHEILLWQRGADEGANLMAAAREARLRLLSQWAAARGLDAVLLGHTADDQAETFLMRIARGAGIDGLSGMAARRESHGMIWLRPMLTTGREELRDWLRAGGIGWIDDPSNENRDFERVRMRQALDLLAIPADRFVQSAANLASAREALAEIAAEVAAGAEASRGRLILPLARFLAAPDEIRRRLLVAALRWLSGQDYPPRREKIAQALGAIADGRKVTLEGAILQSRGDGLMILREPEAARRALDARPDAAGVAIWDRRWRIEGMAPDQIVTALQPSELTEFDWRGLGMTRDEAASGPAIRLAEGAGAGRLIAAPMISQVEKPTARALRGAEHFRAMLFSH